MRRKLCQEPSATHQLTSLLSASDLVAQLMGQWTSLCRYYMLYREYREFPQANSDMILSKTLKRFRILRLASRIKFEMQVPLIGWR